MEQLPAWAIAIFGVLGVVMFIINILTSVFIFSYLFLWKKMRVWFNKKAGAEFMPAKRIERPQIIAGMAGVVLAIIMAISGVTGAKAAEFKFTPFTIALAIAQWGALIWFVIYCRKLYQNRVERMGKKLAKWSVIYLLCSCATIVLISAALATYAMMLYALLFIMDKTWDFSMKGAPGSNSSSGSSTPQYKCCSSCKHYSYGKCNERPGATISDPDRDSCGIHTF